MNENVDTIELTLPFKAQYVSVARLAASGVASRIGFDIETIEDIKVAIAEVCNKFVSTGSGTADSYRVTFNVTSNSINIIFDCDDKSLKCIFGDGNDEFGVSIINALMDSVELCTTKEYILSMSKTLEETM